MLAELVEIAKSLAGVSGISLNSENPVSETVQQMLAELVEISKSLAGVSGISLNSENPVNETNKC